MSKSGSHNSIGNLAHMYFCRGVACDYFGVYGTRSHVIRVVGFWRGPKFEANVHCLNPSATDPVAEGFRRCTLGSDLKPLSRSLRSLKEEKNGSFWATTHPWVNWAQQPWLVAHLGEGQLRFETHECQVCWTDSTCEDHGSMGMSVHPENCAPAMGQLPLCLRGRFLSQRLREGHSDRKPTASWLPQLS